MAKDYSKEAFKKVGGDLAMSVNKIVSKKNDYTDQHVTLKGRFLDSLNQDQKLLYNDICKLEVIYYMSSNFYPIKRIKTKVLLKIKRKLLESKLSISQKILFERLNHLSDIVIKQRVGMYMKGSEIGNKVHKVVEWNE